MGHEKKVMSGALAHAAEAVIPLDDDQQRADF
jgi:hypothetical protein